MVRFTYSRFTIPLRIIRDMMPRDCFYINTELITDHQTGSIYDSCLFIPTECGSSCKVHDRYIDCIMAYLESLGDAPVPRYAARLGHHRSGNG